MVIGNSYNRDRNNAEKSLLAKTEQTQSNTRAEQHWLEAVITYQVD
jgi:hypothetical protein